MRRCVTCGKIIWPWQHYGQKQRRYSSVMSKPWHAPKCEPWWAKRNDLSTWENG